MVLEPRALPALLTPYVPWRSGSHSSRGGGARGRPPGEPPSEDRSAQVGLLHCLAQREPIEYPLAVEAVSVQQPVHVRPHFISALFCCICTSAPGRVACSRRSLSGFLSGASTAARSRSRAATRSAWSTSSASRCAARAPFSRPALPPRPADAPPRTRLLSTDL